MLRPPLLLSVGLLLLGLQSAADLFARAKKSEV